MKKWSNKKAEWLLVMLAVSLTASASWTIPAEEKSEAIDRYIIVELETLTVPNVVAEEMELSSESEQSTEETVEVESEPEVVLFSLQDSLDSEEYSVTGISVAEPIFATMSSDELKKSVAKRLLVLQRSINLIQFIRLQIQHFISAFCFFMGNLL